MRRFLQAVVVGGVAAAVLVPSASVLASEHGTGGDRGSGVHECSGDHETEQLGTGNGRGDQHQRGVMDGTGPQGHRAMDGSGNRWAAGR